MGFWKTIRLNSIQSSSCFFFVTFKVPIQIFYLLDQTYVAYWLNGKKTNSKTLFINHVCAVQTHKNFTSGWFILHKAGSWCFSWCDAKNGKCSTNHTRNKQTVNNYHLFFLLQKCLREVDLFLLSYIALMFKLAKKTQSHLYIRLKPKYIGGKRLAFY